MTQRSTSAIPIVASSLEELLSYRDQQFVHCAYQTLLGRAPDSEGFLYYLEMIRAGVSRIQILKELRLSSEGKARNTNLSGLDATILRYRIGQLPCVGFLFRLFHGTEGNSNSECALRVMQNQILLLTDESDRRFGALEEWHLGDSAGDLFAFFTKKRVFFNLSTSKHWRRQPVGIVRVERELAKYLRQFSDVCFIFWDTNSHCFKILRHTEVREILSDGWCETQTTSNRFNLNSDANLPELRKNDIVISFGLDWDLSPTHEIARLVQGTGCDVVLACYDLVPILFPEFCVRSDLDQLFKQHFVDMGHIARRVIAISENSKKDLLGFWKRAQLEVSLPKIDVIPLASLSCPNRLPELNDSQLADLDAITKQGEYVLYVSSFEARKNHQLLLNVWRDLYHGRGDRCPQLIIVGMPGWGMNDLTDQMCRMQAYGAGKIKWLDNVHDGLLLHLYKHCSFSVYPSHYEGWGLAATEAMAFGKICIIADNSALTEATQGLMPSYHPMDYLGWKNEIERLVDDDDYKKNLELVIQSEFRQRSWQQFAQEFCQKLCMPMQELP